MVWSSFSILSRVFPQSFSLSFWFPNPLFFTLELSCYPIYRIFILWENLFVIEIDHQVLYPSLICVIPLVRGDCGYPSSERLIVEVVLVSLLVKRWIAVVRLSAYPSFVRLILLALCLASKCRGCFCWERSCVLQNCNCPKFSVEVACVRSPVWMS